MRQAQIAEHTMVKRALTLMALFFLLVIVRLFWLQVVNGTELAAKERAQILSEVKLHAPRGAILDRNGQELAVSLIARSLYVDPAAVVDVPEEWPGNQPPARDPKKVAAQVLAPILKHPENELAALFAGDGRFAWVERTMEPLLEQQVRQVLKENKLHGFGFLDESKRYYPKGRLAAQAIGFAGTDDKGLSGMELTMDSVLKGREDTIRLQTDMDNRPIFTSVLVSTRPKDANKVQLTLDGHIQFLAEQVADSAMAKNQARAVTILIMNPKTGEILAMVNRPTFDPNQFWKAAPAAWNNRAVTSMYEPGSTFKPIVAAGAVEEKLVSPGSVFNDTGAIQAGDRTIRNWSGEGYGRVTFADTIKNSINTIMVQVGNMLGAERLNKYARQFGFGESTGSGLEGEGEGLLFNSSQMRPSDIGTMSIGQSIAVTPLQLLRALSAMANDGKLMKPYMLEKIVDGDGNVLRQQQPEVIRQAVTKETANTVFGMMEQVISSGGGVGGKIPGYRFAGKTGTAERLNDDGSGYASGQYIASFVGIGPVEDPRFAVLIIIDTPKGDIYGGQIAAPVFRQLMEPLLTYAGIPPSHPEELPNWSQTGLKAIAPRSAAAVVRTPDGKVLLPDLTGLMMRETAARLAERNLAMEPFGSGRAIRQSPAPGTAMPAGATVQVWFTWP